MTHRYSYLFIIILCSFIYSGSQAQVIHGYADIHNHQFANLAFGKRVCVGDPYGPIDKALGWCNEVHGWGGVLDHVDKIRALRLGHHVGGYPQFDGWPRHNSYTHQTVYQDWLKRAHQGGLQLMVMLAVNNEGLCHIQGPHNSDYSLCDDMVAIDLQLQGAKDMEAYIDQYDGGWYKIVYSPEEARQAIQAGKLAVVLGVEVDFLFDCRNENDCAEAQVSSELDVLYNKGVRHIIPIHLYDNAFGGAALYSDTNTDAYNITGSPLPTSLYSPEKETKSGYKWSVNQKGLTNLGKYFMRAIIEKGMLLDIDHMSIKSKETVFEIAAEYDYPLIASHTGFKDQHSENNIKRNEYNLNEEEILGIKNSGGMVAPILMLHENLSPLNPYSGEEECQKSSEAFLKAYRYAIARLGEFQVALGSDFNSGAGLPRPRFGGDGCYQNNSTMVNYPFTSKANGQVFHKCKSGDRIFDVNIDGLPHIGLLPDFIEELSQMGLTDQELKPLFNSAEGYVRSWEKSEANKSKSTSASVSSNLDQHAIVCDGNTDINIPGVITQNLTAFTLEAWVYNTTTQNDIQAIISSAGPSFAHLQMSSDPHVNCAVYVDGHNSIILPAIPKLSHGWHHVALTVKSGNSQVFLDGAPLGAQNTQTFSTINPCDKFSIGKGWAEGRKFHGKIANVRMWNTWRSVAEIKQHANNFNLNSHPNIVYHSPTSNPILISSENDCLPVPSNATVGLQSVTIEAWVKKDHPQHDIYAIISSTEGAFVHFQLSGNTNNKNAVYLNDGRSIMLPIIPQLTPGWHHVAIVVESGNSRVLVDGEQIGPPDLTTFSGLKDSHSVYVGKGWQGDRIFKGTIADVRIWKNRVLTNTQLNDYAQTPPPPSAYRLAFHLK